MLSIFDLFTLKKVTGEDTQKIVLKSPIWLKISFAFLLFVKIFCIFNWYINTITSKILNYLYTPQNIHGDLLSKNLIIITGCLLALLILDNYMLRVINLTFIINKNAKTIYIKEYKTLEKRGLNDEFSMVINNKGLFPNFKILRKKENYKTGLVSIG